MSSRPFNLALLFASLFFIGTAAAQEIDATAPSTTPSPFVPDAADTTPTVTSSPKITANPEMTHQEMTADLVIRAIEESDVGPVRKMLARAAMRRTIPAQLVTDRVTAIAVERGAIPLPPPTAWSTLEVVSLDDDQIAAAVDWDEIFKIVMEFLPLLLKILSFF